MDGIIFDVDGTLWDSTDVVAEAYNVVIGKKTNLPADITGARLKQLFGKPMDEICAAVFTGMPKEEQLDLGEQCFVYENEYLETHHGKLYEGVEKTLEILARREKLYIVSNCQCGYIEVFLKTMGLEKYFEDHLCFGETKVSKDITIRMLMEKHGMKDAVYVGDTAGDAEASAKAQIPFIYCKYGFGEVPDYETGIASFQDLINIV